ncbi:MAG: hypothetical protein JWP20_2841, partial [Roseomonas sp.]|nr:hypothetical protein [Roseomonas sp.]
MQHFRRLAATAVITGLLGMPLLAHAQESGGFVQRGVKVEATAENAVIARTRALASAQRQAFEKMAAELGISRSASDSQIDGLVDSIIIEQERATRTGYNGRLTVNFNPRRVANFGGVSAGGGGAVAGSDAAPPVVPGNLNASAPAAFNPASAFVESVTAFGGMQEWLDLRRRLLAGPEVASVDILAIAVDGARLRLGLRTPPNEAARTLALRGIVLQQQGAVPPASQG